MVRDVECARLQLVVCWHCSYIGMESHAWFFAVHVTQSHVSRCSMRARGFLPTPKRWMCCVATYLSRVAPLRAIRLPTPAGYFPVIFCYHTGKKNSTRKPFLLLRDTLYQSTSDRCHYFCRYPPFCLPLEEQKVTVYF